MTVKELIEQLQKLPPSMEVKVQEDWDGGDWYVLGAKVVQDTFYGTKDYVQIYGE